MLLDINRWKTYIKPSLNDDLCVFRNLKHVKIAYFWWFLELFSRNMGFLERICRVHIYNILQFLSYTNCKKVWNFYPFLFVGTILSPPPYETRSLCTGVWSTLNVLFWTVSNYLSALGEGGYEAWFLSLAEAATAAAMMAAPSSELRLEARFWSLPMLPTLQPWDSSKLTSRLEKQKEAVNHDVGNPWRPYKPFRQIT